MSNIDKTYYALQNHEGNLIGLDMQSGGYPWTPSTLNGVWIEENIDLLKDYNKTFGNTFTIVEVNISIKRI